MVSPFWIEGSRTRRGGLKVDRDEIGELEEEERGEEKGAEL